MNAKSGDLTKAWVDPDDAPEITEELIARGKWKIGGRTVARSDALAELTTENLESSDPEQGGRVSATVRLDADVVDAFRQSGDGWQAKMNAALRDWLATHRVI